MCFFVTPFSLPFCINTAHAHMQSRELHSISTPVHTPSAHLTSYQLAFSRREGGGYGISVLGGPFFFVHFCFGLFCLPNVILCLPVPHLRCILRATDSHLENVLAKPAFIAHMCCYRTTFSFARHPAINVFFALRPAYDVDPP